MNFWGYGNINYIVKNHRGCTVGGSETKEGAIEIMNKQIKEAKKYHQNCMFHIEEAK